MKHVFNELSQSTLQQNQDNFFKLAKERLSIQSDQHAKGLEHKKELIDQTLNNVKKEIEHVKSGLQSIESNHQRRF